MSTGYALLLAFDIFYFSIGIGTAIKHSKNIKARHIPYYIFLLPAKTLAKAFALIPLFASVIGYAHVWTKERGKFTKKECEDFTIAIGYDFFL